MSGMIQALKDKLRRKEAYRSVLLADNEDARLVLHDITNAAFPKKPLVKEGAPDTTAYACGVHAHALGIIHLLFDSDAELHKQIRDMQEHENQTT